MSHPKEILTRLQASALKSLSQNFLTSPHWADLLTNQAVEAATAQEIWEIGPGLGALTSRLLAKTTRPIKAFEYDRKLSAYLRETFPRLEVIEGDFLKVDLTQIAPHAQRIAIISNLPYHLSSPVFFRLIETKERWTRLILTFQKEFAERLVAVPSTPAYGALSVLAQLHYSIARLGVLPPGAFYPAPGVASEALLLEPHPAPTIGMDKVSRVVKAAFAHRRKKLSNNLKQAFPLAPLGGLLAGSVLSLHCRPEELSKEQYVSLTEALAPYLT
jgi:16S rRNA (adenine1518-N6/adenine1519-N6)-dimethyltransferase